MPLLDAVLKVNADQPLKMIELLKRHLGDDLRGRRVSVLGLAFKPDTDDVRESPALTIVRQLADLGADVTAYDPVATHEAKKVLNTTKVRYAADLPGSLVGTEGVLLVTKWDEFKAVSALLAKMERPPVLIDGRRFIEPSQVARYDGIGLGAMKSER